MQSHRRRRWEVGGGGGYESRRRGERRDDEDMETRRGEEMEMKVEMGGEEEERREGRTRREAEHGEIMEPEALRIKNYIKNSSVYTHTKESSLLYTDDDDDDRLWLQVNGKPVNVISNWGGDGAWPHWRTHSASEPPHRHNFASYMGVVG